jgi:protein gp37
MALQSKIEWTSATWNPITGCRKLSEGCQNCYAERMAKRLKAMGKPNYAQGFAPTTHPDALGIPMHWKKPRLVFVCSMSDLFLGDTPFPFVQRVFKVMNECDQHTFQVLTKRPHVALKYAKLLTWSDNIWMGATVENDGALPRIDLLRQIPAKVRFLSIEPLLGPLPPLALDGIHWVIVGGESGPKARLMQAEWVRPIRDQCIQDEIPFFFKQWGGVNKKKTGRTLDGKLWDQMPNDTE